MPLDEKMLALLAKVKASQLGKDSNGNLVSKRPDLSAENDLLSHMGANTSDDDIETDDYYNQNVKQVINDDNRNSVTLLKALLAKKYGREFNDKTIWEKLLSAKYAPPSDDDDFDSFFTDQLNPTNPLSPLSPLQRR